MHIRCIISYVNNILNYVNSSLNLYFPIYLGDGHKQKKYALNLPLAHHLDDFVDKIGTEIYNLSSKEHLHINIAYGHYLSALMQHDYILEDFYLEKRITESIMGLEALFLTGKSKSSSKVKKRTSKLFEMLLKIEIKKCRKF